MWNVIFCALTAILCVVCSLWTYTVARNVSQVLASQQENSRLLESRVRSLTTSVENWSQITEELATTFKMQKVRAAFRQKNASNGGEPDAKSDPEAWRAWKNAQLRAGVFNQ